MVYSIGVTLISLCLNELEDHSRPRRTFNKQVFVRVTTSIKFVRLMNQAYPGHVYHVCLFILITPIIAAHTVSSSSLSTIRQTHRNMTTLSKCCVSGHLHQGEPKGTVEKFAGLDTYITGTNASRTIMVITVCMKLDGRAMLIAGYLWDPIAGKHQTNHLEDRADQNRTSSSSRMNTRKPATCVSSCQTSFSVCVPIFTETVG